MRIERRRRKHPVLTAVLALGIAGACFAAGFLLTRLLASSLC